ncbi:CYCL1-1, partial [Symbiodinium sp. CCMP2456]
GATPAIAESHAGLGLVKRQKQLECHPTRKYLEECRLEWEEYGQKLKELGAPKPCPPYPYTVKIVEALMKENEDDALARMSR